MYDELDEMRSWIAQDNWDGLEREFRSRAERAAPDAARRIARVELGAYEAELQAALMRLASQPQGETKAIYWEFDPDNDWRSAWFRCRSYQPESAGEDEWASDFRESDVTPGPDAPGLAAEFARGWDLDDETSARNLFLVARTVAALGRASTIWRLHLPLCAGYHDQDVVFRVRDA